MKKIKKTPLAAAMGTALATSLSASTVIAESNPFSVSELTDGYMQVAEQGWTVKPYKKGAEAACGEGKCGAMMDGEKMKKGMENACGAMMKGKEGACGMKKADEMKCGAMMKGGEMKCGDMMKGGEMKCGEMMKKGEMKCGAMMKGGEMKCGDMMKDKK